MAQRQFTLLLALLALVSLTSLVSAQRFDAPPYAERGPYAVGTFDFIIESDTRPLAGTVWYPAQASDQDPATYLVAPTLRVPGSAILNAAPDTAEAPYPLVVLSHGSGSSSVLHLHFTERLASYGFIVIAADHPQNNVIATLFNSNDFALNYALRPQDVLRQIRYAETLNNDHPTLNRMIDTERVGVSGHSFGGITALLAAGGQLDFTALARYCQGTENAAFGGVCFLLNEQANIVENHPGELSEAGLLPALSHERIRAVVTFAPWNGPILNLEGVTAPAMIQVGSADSVTIPERDAYAMYERLATTKSLVVFENGSHNLFIDPCSEPFFRLNLEENCTDPVWDMQRVHDLSDHFAIAFFEQHLKDNEEAADALAPTANDFIGVQYERIENE